MAPNYRFFLKVSVKSYKSHLKVKVFRENFGFKIYFSS